jgi:hypothetical protein
MDACGTVYAKCPGPRLEGEDFEAELYFGEGSTTEVLCVRARCQLACLSTSFSKSLTKETQNYHANIAKVSEVRTDQLAFQKIKSPTLSHTPRQRWGTLLT